MGDSTLTAVKARDGASITVESFGDGPGVVVVHGGGVSAKDYRRLARALAATCAVHLFSRRGRPGGADLPDAGYTVAVDVDDIRAVVEHTGATGLFGHSIGGFIALRAALELPVERLALYDPAVVVDGLFPTDYLDDFDAAIQAGQYAEAVAVVGRGLRSAGRLSDLPMGAQLAMARLFLHTPIGRDWLGTIHTVPAEAREAVRYAGSADLYAAVRASALLVTGSGSPDYYGPTNEKLAGALPRARSITLRGFRHDAPNIARPRFVRPFAEFLAAVA
jgi:pimeloyl-ACP methyl ester carboxylesterase